MDISCEKSKKKIIKRHTPKTKIVKTCAAAFFFGALICALGEGARILFVYLGAPDKTAVSLVSIVFVVLAALLTAVGVFDKIARHAGAGTLVPITGFSNAVTSEAIDSSSEGYILGVGAKIFTVAGPVLLFGITAGAVYGVIYYIVTNFVGV